MSACVLVFQQNFTDKRECEALPEKTIKLNDRNIKVSKAGYIYIQKYIKGVHIRISTKLKATKENLALVQQEAHNYIKNELVRQGFILEGSTKRSPDEYLSESMLYVLQGLTDIKESSYARYKSAMLTIQKDLKHARTNNVNKNFLHDYATALHKKALSNAEIKSRINLIVRALNNYNEYFNLPYFTNTLNLSRFGAEKKEKYAFKENELATILESSKKDEILHNYLMIASHTGARVGEILALKSSDIDTESIKITKSKMPNNTITTPKTKSSKRNIAFINENFKHFMHDLKAKYTDTLFNISHSCLQKKWKKLLSELNIHKETPIYNLRHTFATLAIQKGFNILQVSRTLGHKDGHITSTTYAINTNCFIENMQINLTKEEA